MNRNLISEVNRRSRRAHAARAADAAPPIAGTRRDEPRLRRRLRVELEGCARWTTRERHPKTGKVIVRVHVREPRRVKRLRARLVRYDARRQLRALRATP